MTNLIPADPVAPSLGWRTVTMHVGSMTGAPLGELRGRGGWAVHFALSGDIRVPGDKSIIGALRGVTVKLDPTTGRGQLQLPVWDGSTGDWVVMVKPSWSGERFAIRVPAGSGPVDLSEVPVVVPPKAGLLRAIF